MARPSKMMQEMLAKEEEAQNAEKLIAMDTDLIAQLTKRIEELEARCKVEDAVVIKSVQRTDRHYDEEPIPPHEESGLKMRYSDKIFSMQNAAKILPPNLIVDGRHSKEKIEALCGFKVTDEMMDEAYATLKHEEY